jgi:hypothetical protein
LTTSAKERTRKLGEEHRPLVKLEHQAEHTGEGLTGRAPRSSRTCRGAHHDPTGTEAEGYRLSPSSNEPTTAALEPGLFDTLLNIPCRSTLP